MYLQLQSCISAGSSGTFSYTFTEDEMWEQNIMRYSLHVTAIHKHTTATATLSGSFRVFGHQEKYFCSLNMINTGTRPIPKGGYLEFISVGMATKFNCTMDKGPVQQCKLIFVVVIM